VGFDNQDKRQQQEIVYSQKIKAGKRRTYFFDVRRTRGDDFFITITESTRRMEDDVFIRHKIFLYKEDFNRFMQAFGETIEFVKTELMPDYDYDEFTRRYEEYDEENNNNENNNSNNSHNNNNSNEDGDASKW
jgi:hypothetical protein